MKSLAQAAPAVERDEPCLSIARDPNASRLAAILPLQFVEFLLKLRDSGELGLKIAPALTHVVGKFFVVDSDAHADSH